MDEEIEVKVDDQILEYAIFYCQNGTYPDNLSKDKKRAVRKKAKSISVEREEVFVVKKNIRVSHNLH